MKARHPMTDKLKLFTSPSAFPNPQRLRIFMHEKGIADHFDETIYDNRPDGGVPKIAA
jgi:glutathione S-transferase